MRSDLDLMAPPVLGISWLAAAAALPLALIMAMVGQGLGALVGGCGWIGLSLPIDRQVWALVNQPVLNFASEPVAAGYWLGSLVLPLAIAATLVPLLPRARSLTAELAVVQMAWGAAVVAVAWLPLLDADDGHLVRWLALHGMPVRVTWLVPLLGAGAALLPTLRLLALARRQRQHTGRGFRLLVVAAHLGLPLAIWVGMASAIRGSLPSAAAIAVAIALSASLMLAWFRYPAPFVHPLREPSAGGVLGLALAVIVMAASLWVGGRRLPDEKSAGVLWGQPQAFNNIRQWIEPIPVALRRP